ncbi:hypothetical protein CDAR_399231 [Caerostris darwini]|uniref:Uncharacterized protein n=1 Tax=Caerostris darwini TaxID=1538125 RepID=A0AAV4SY56_9ARAC|nr:hypothetical protein CDAR_399231 [Caerostris darwini]
MEGPPAQTFRPNEKGNRGTQGLFPGLSTAGPALIMHSFAQVLTAPALGRRTPLFGRRALQLTGASNGAEIYPLSTFLSFYQGSFVPSLGFIYTGDG